MEPTIPEHEIDCLRLTTEDADELAEAGDFADGCDLLRGAQYRAELLLEEGKPWAPALLDRYRWELEQFYARNGYPTRRAG